MAQIIIDIPNLKVGRVNDALSAKYGWTIDSGITKAQASKRRIIDLIKQDVLSWEEAEAAKQTAFTDLTDIT